MKTFLDAGVLISAWRGNSAAAAAAKQILEDERRNFLSSDNVRLEVLPKPAFEKRPLELDFYSVFFQRAETSEPFSDELGRDALALAKKYGLASGDALNLASAIRQGAKEFFTSELPGKPMFRVREVKVVSIHA